MAGTSEQWVPREQWDAQVRGENCPACIEVQSTARRNRDGYFVADLDLSRLRLGANQHVPGYCVLICRKHVREPYELDRLDRIAYFENLTRVGEALEKVFGAVKMNFQILGNICPHLHYHVTPRYYGDPYPGRPVDWDRQVLLTPEEYDERIGLIRAALSGT